MSLREKSISDHKWKGQPENIVRWFACDCARRTLLLEEAKGREPEEYLWRVLWTAQSHALGQADSRSLEGAREIQAEAEGKPHSEGEFARGVPYNKARKSQFHKLWSPTDFCLAALRREVQNTVAATLEDDPCLAAEKAAQSAQRAALLSVPTKSQSEEALLAEKLTQEVQWRSFQAVSQHSGEQAMYVLYDGGHIRGQLIHHPALQCKKWHTGLLSCLPEDLLQWFLCDCCEEVLLSLQKDPKDRCWELVRNARRLITEELASDECGPLPRQEQTMEAELPLFRALSVLCSSLHAPLHRDAAWSALSSFEKMLGDEGITLLARGWLLARLQYLIKVWQLCGERSAWLLLEGLCPLPFDALAA